jgi:hypothetical protein
MEARLTRAYGFSPPEPTDQWLHGITIPKGMVYQWKRFEVAGVRQTKYIKDLEKNGWRKVPKRRHPKANSSSEKWIIWHGNVLMARPKKLDDQAVAEDLAIALEQTGAVEKWNKHGH